MHPNCKLSRVLMMVLLPREFRFYPGTDRAGKIIRQTLDHQSAWVIDFWRVAVNPFFKQVYEVVEQIPYGRVISYGEIARLLGRPRAAREVGWAMRNCPEELPWQRVVMADGTITGGAFADTRREMLESEGVDFLPDGRVDMKISRWL